MENQEENKTGQAGSSSTADQQVLVPKSEDAGSNPATGTTNAPPPEATDATGRVRMCPICWKPKWSTNPQETPICQCGVMKKMLPEVVRKLEEAFSIGANISQSCFYADISRDTYYRWINENPELSDRFTAFQDKVPLKAKENIARSIHAGSVGDSWRLLEKRDPDYTDKVKIDVNSNQRSRIEVDPEEEAAWQDYVNRSRKALHRRSDEMDGDYQEFLKAKVLKQDERPATGELAGQVGGTK